VSCGVADEAIRQTSISVSPTPRRRMRTSYCGTDFGVSIK